VPAVTSDEHGDPLSHASTYSRLSVALAALAIAWPVIILACLYSTWLNASLILGHPPTPYADDPKYLSAPLPILALISALLIISWPFPFIGGLFAVAWLERHIPTRKVIALLVGYILLWSSAIAIFMWDPLSASNWLFD